MKKFTALLLCVAMLMVGVVAQAETGYEFVKEFLTSEDGENLCDYFSTELTRSGDTDKLLYISFDFSETAIYLLGDNSAGQYEGTVWHPNQLEFLNVLSMFCGSWSTLNKYVESDYLLIIAIDLGDDDPILIATEEDASAMYEVLKEIKNEGSN